MKESINLISVSTVRNKPIITQTHHTVLQCPEDCSRGQMFQR